VTIDFERPFVAAPAGPAGLKLNTIISPADKATEAPAYNFAFKRFIILSLQVFGWIEGDSA
jgi:hypothetical protein